MKLFIFLFFFVLSSCGESPFLQNIAKPIAKITPLEPAEDPRDLFDDSYTRLSFDELDFFVRFNQDVIVFENMSLEIAVLKGNEFYSPKDLFIELWMPDHGHGSWPVKIEETDTGRFLATEVFFTMPGLWDVIFHYKLNEKEKREIWSFEL